MARKPTGPSIGGITRGPGGAINTPFGTLTPQPPKPPSVGGITLGPGGAINTPFGTLTPQGARPTSETPPRPNDPPSGTEQRQPAIAPYVTGTYTKREIGGWVRTYQTWSDGRTTTLDEYQDKSAGEMVADMFRNAGLDSKFVDQLMSLIDGIYNTNVNVSQSMINNAIYSSDAYKTRFAGNEIIRKRMADGQGRPGDRLLSPAEYIAAENTYRQILQEASMPQGYYDSPEDFNNLIANGVSPAEFKSREATAFDSLNNADDYVKNTLRDYYGLSNSDIAAYLLDPSKAMPVIEGRAAANGAFGMNSNTELQKMYETAQVGATAARQGLPVDSAFSTEIVNLGKSDQAEAAFADAGKNADSAQRLGSLYGEALDFKDLVRETLNMSGGTEVGRKRRKFASKERAAFNSQGALDSKSLSRMQDV